MLSAMESPDSITDGAARAARETWAQSVMLGDDSMHPLVRQALSQEYLNDDEYPASERAKEAGYVLEEGRFVQPSEPSEREMLTSSVKW